MNLKGRTAVVTGAAQGIGQAIAERLVAEGANVLCADRNPAIHDTAKALGAQAHSIEVDVAHASQVAGMIGTARDRWGGIDILCNNAGIDGSPAMLADSSEEDFDLVVGVNLKGVFLGMKYAIPLMVQAGGGSIINTSSAAGLVGISTLSIYSATKAGVIGLTRSAALEYGPSKVRINAICPGGVLTPLNAEFIKGDAEAFAEWERQHALGRMAEPIEIAGLVAFLASDDASFITGAAIPIDGGLTAK